MRTEDLKPGERLGRYLLGPELGRGAMGMVFLAEDTLLKQRLCVKVLHPALAQHPEAAERFNREIVLARRVAHRGVCRLHDIHEENGLRFITMEYAEGVPLRDLLVSDAAQLPIERVIAIGANVCDALSAAHEVGVVHRDLKPRNIMVRDDGEVTLLDFGIARALDNQSSLTLPGVALGTRHYIAPEVWAGRPATPRSDQFSVGVILFNCLTGKMPFFAAKDMLLLEAMAKHPPPAPSLIRADAPPALDAVVLRALSFNPEDRFPDVRALARALRDVGTVRVSLGTTSSPLPVVVAEIPQTLPGRPVTTTSESSQSPLTLGDVTMVSVAPTDPTLVRGSLGSNPPLPEPGLTAVIDDIALAPTRKSASAPGGAPVSSSASWVVAGNAVDRSPAPYARDAATVRIVDATTDEVDRPRRRRGPALVVAALGVVAVAAAVAIALFVVSRREDASANTTTTASATANGATTRTNATAASTGAASSTNAANVGVASTNTTNTGAVTSTNAGSTGAVATTGAVAASAANTGAAATAASTGATTARTGANAASAGAATTTVETTGVASAATAEEPAGQGEEPVVSAAVERSTHKSGGGGGGGARGAADSRTRYLEEKTALDKILAQKGIAAGDDAELDRLRQKALGEAQQRHWSDARDLAVDAKRRADGVLVDKGFVKKKLVRFNDRYDAVNADAAAHGKIDAMSAEVLKQMKEGRYDEANKTLNEALAVLARIKNP